MTTIPKLPGDKPTRFTPEHTYLDMAGKPIKRPLPTNPAILPRPDGPPQQRLLPPEAWAEPFARCLHLITGENARA